MERDYKRSIKRAVTSFFYPWCLFQFLRLSLGAAIGDCSANEQHGPDKPQQRAAPWQLLVRKILHSSTGQWGTATGTPVSARDLPFPPKLMTKQGEGGFPLQERMSIIVILLLDFSYSSANAPVVHAGKDTVMVSPSMDLPPTMAFKAGRNFLKPILPLQRAVHPPHPKLLVMFSKRSQRQKNYFILSLRVFSPPPLPLGWRGKHQKTPNYWNKKKKHIPHMNALGWFKAMKNASCSKPADCQNSLQSHFDKLKL